MNPFLEFYQHNNVLAKIEQAINTKSTTLILREDDLDIIPNPLVKCTDLLRLSLAKNKIKQIPNALLALNNLQALEIDFNCLDHFPSVLKHMTRLKMLNISHNAIGDLSEVGYLTNLLYLWCNDCNLETIPDSIENLEHLECFGVRNNKVKELPNGFSKLRKLKWVTFENNQIMSLPKNFYQLRDLQHINLNQNKFNVIPGQLAHLKHVKYLTMRNNQLFNLDESLLNKMGHYVKIDLTGNPISVDEAVLKSFNNILFPGADYNPPSMESSDSTQTDDDSSSAPSEDWEESTKSSEIDFEDLLDEDLEADVEVDDAEALAFVYRMPKFLL